MCYCHTAIWWKDKISPQAEREPDSEQVGLETDKMKTDGRDHGAESITQIQMVYLYTGVHLFSF